MDRCTYLSSQTHATARQQFAASNLGRHHAEFGASDEADEVIHFGVEIGGFEVLLLVRVGGLDTFGGMDLLRHVDGLCGCEVTKL